MIGRGGRFALLSAAICFLFLSLVEDVRCDDVLHAHVIAHTHDDVGWLKTVDEYYYGANNSIYDAGVQYILDTVIPALQSNPDRKFIYVEIAYFYRWWNEQSEAMKEVVRDLVSQRRLEFCLGGWVMNDEAATFYPAVIDQMTLGHRFLLKEFGVKPTIGWHIDPFGHSSAQESMFAMMGFNGFFFARIDYQDNYYRNKTKRLEMVWRGSKSLGEKTEIFTHVLYGNTYCPPPGFNFQSGNTEPVRFDPRLFSYNMKKIAEQFVQTVKHRAESYRTPEILIPLGCDFEYQNAIINFKNMDLVIDYVNAHPEYGVRAFYSTPSIYTEAVHKYAETADITWDVKTDDFFPYADHPYAYWTGYFTSRPSLKGYIRTRSALYHAVQKIASTGAGVIPGFITKSVMDNIEVLAHAMGTNQHHDAVTGTEKQHVADDYAKRLSIGTAAVHDALQDMLGKLIAPKSSDQSPLHFSFCEYLNMSICEPLLQLAKGRSVPVVAYNPLGWDRTEYIRLPVPNQNVTVTDKNGKRLETQILPNGDFPKQMFTLVFSVDLPPSGFRSFVVHPTASRSLSSNKGMLEYVGDEDVVVENEYVKLTFSGATNRMDRFENKALRSGISIEQNLLWWNASAGNNVNSSQASGAYIFRPNGTAPHTFTTDNKPTLSVVHGSLVSEVRQRWSSWAYQTVRLYKGQQHVEVEATIGPIDISDGLGKEVITRYTTDISSNKLFWTDAQGREMQRRERNHRPSWKLNVTNPVSGNYYPMNSASYIKDESLQFTLMSDRSQGASSLDDGALEAMMHRRLLYDDGRGVAEALNETEAIRATHWSVLETPGTSARHMRPLTLRLNQPVQLAFVSDFQGDASQFYASYHATEFAPLSETLPPNVHLLNLRPLDEGMTLVRLNHIYAVDEDEEYSRPATVDLNALFAHLDIQSIEEMSLSGNQPLSDVHRLKWKTPTTTKTATRAGDRFGKYHHHRSQRNASADAGDGVDAKVTLSPMEIKTFMVRFAPK